MHFTKIATSTLLFTLSSMSLAAPQPSPLDRRITSLEARTNDIIARSGWTCNFLGGEACQVKVCSSIPCKAAN